MNWVRGRRDWLRDWLREWLSPKAVEAAIKRLERDNKKVLDAEKKLLQEAVRETHQFLFGTKDRIMADAAQKINDEMVSGMFYRFPEKKMVSVKQVVRQLLDYLDLELAIRKDPNATRELIVKIVKKKSKAKEKKVKPAKKE